MSEPMKKVSLPSDANASGRSFGEEELALLREVIESGTLNCTKGVQVNRFTDRFAQMTGASVCKAVTSGTAAMHTAIAAIDPEPGDEVITTPITDMGAITPILFQTAIPVFADVDPLTYNVTAKTLAARITRRTRAIVVTHLFGNPCDMDPILELCRSRNIPLIEDCAQAFGAEYKGIPVGRFGAVGAFSLQQGKHITSGEGGMVITSDEKLGRRMKLFIDKAWGYGDAKPDHYFLAPNYRMTELAGAVASAQLEKLPLLVERRIAMVARLNRAIEGAPGVSAPKVTAGAKHTYWRYALRVDREIIRGGADALGKLLAAEGVFCGPRYIQKLAFECEVLRDQRTFGNSRFPFVGAHRTNDPPVVYDVRDTPGAVEALAGVVVLPWNERYTDEHVDFIAEVIRAAAAKLASGGAA